MPGDRGKKKRSEKKHHVAFLVFLEPIRDGFDVFRVEIFDHDTYSFFGLDGG